MIERAAKEEEEEEERSTVRRYHQTVCENREGKDGRVNAINALKE